VADSGRPAFQRGTDRILGGVCAGLAAGFHVDPLVVRIVFVILAFFQGVGLFIYLVLWLVMPEAADRAAPGRSGFDSMADDLKRVGGELRAQFGSGGRVPPGVQSAPRGRQTLVLGLFLVVFGGLLLAINTGLVRWTVVWPVVVIALGVALLVSALERRA